MNSESIQSQPIFMTFNVIKTDSLVNKTVSDLPINNGENVNITDIVPEDWKSLGNLNYPNYHISSYGRVKNTMRGNFVKTHISNSGYRRVRLSSNGIGTSFLVHRLVALIFLPHENASSLTVDHINRNKHDNRVSNLRWATWEMQQENRTIVSGKSNRPVDQYDINGNFIAKWNSLKEAGNAGFACESIIYEICNQRRHSYNGYIWRYADNEHLLGEIWSQISYEDCEQILVSNKGRMIHSNNRIIIGNLMNGYRRIGLKSSTTGKRRIVRVHRLVMAAFVGENPDMVVNHIDGNPSNNNLENLEYVTQQQNCQHAINTGLKPISTNARAVIVIDKEGKETRYTSCKLASEAMKVFPSHISTLCKSGNNSKYGFSCHHETIIK